MYGLSAESSVSRLNIFWIINKIKKIEVLFREFNGTHKTQNEYHIIQRRIQLIVYRFRKTEFTFKDKFSLLASQKWVMFSYRRHSFSKVSFTHRYTRQIITFQKFNILILIDISIKTHQFLCIRQNQVNSTFYLTFKSTF